MLKIVDDLIILYRLTILFQENNSNDTHVTLEPLELNSSGNYRCEVSAEAPSFQTVSDHQEMITVGKSVWGLGEEKWSKVQIRRILNIFYERLITFYVYAIHTYSPFYFRNK